MSKKIKCILGHKSDEMFSFPVDWHVVDEIAEGNLKGNCLENELFINKDGEIASKTVVYLREISEEQANDLDDGVVYNSEHITLIL